MTFNEVMLSAWFLQIHHFELSQMLHSDDFTPHGLRVIRVPFGKLPADCQVLLMRKSFCLTTLHESLMRGALHTFFTKICLFVGYCIEIYGKRKFVLR